MIKGNSHCFPLQLYEGAMAAMTRRPQRRILTCQAPFLRMDTTPNPSLHWIQPIDRLKIRAKQGMMKRNGMSL